MENLSTEELAKILWEYNRVDQPLEKSDCILVLGSNDIRVAQEGARIFLKRYAPLIIFSGNVGRLTEGLWDKPEAEVFAGEAIKMGVSKDKILIENKSTNTGENLLFTKKLLEEKNINPQSFILLQKPYMQRRAFAAFKKIFPDKKVIVSGPQISFEEYPNKFLPKEYIINVLVGDTQRIKLYAEKGFQIPQEIPINIWSAFEELVRRGYTSHLTKEN